MSALRDRNQYFLNQQQSRLSVSAQSLDNSIIKSSNLNNSLAGDVSFSSWMSQPNFCIIYPQMFPSSKGVEIYKKELAEYSESDIVSNYRGKNADPHLMKALISLVNIETSVGADPFDQETELNFTPSLLLSFGAGDGTWLKELVDTVNPFHLIIAFRSIEDIECSFDTIDWCQWWNDRCNSDRQKISLVQYSSVDNLRNILIDHSLISCEHAFMTVPGPTSQIYLDDRQALSGHELNVCVNYLGFTLDEYNMLWNAADTLKNLPRIFSRPVNPFGSKYIVCGSGPSLDLSIPLLQNAPKDWNIIACASNYRTLRKAGIEVDILCLLERNTFEYDQYLSVKKEFGLGHTCLFASVTCDSRLHTLFDESMIYFRQMLSPLCIFSTDVSQILQFEGPQTVNTGVALCAALGAQTVVFVGLDLGAVSTDKVRSDSAVGNSIRTFDVKVKGNFQPTVFSDQCLLDGKLAIERCLDLMPQAKVFNASNGVFIKGAVPLALSKVFSQYQHSTSSSVESKMWQSWWNQRPYFDSKALLLHWEASRPRVHISRTMSEIRELMLSDDPWFPTIQDKLTASLSLSLEDVPIPHQLGRRLCRGLFMKLAIVISRQCFVLLKQDPSGELQKKFLHKARAMIVDTCDLLEVEFLDLIDSVELNLKS